AAVAGIALGVALLTKHTLILLYALLPLMWLLDMSRDSKPMRWRTLLHASIVVLVSLYVLNLGYGVENSGWRLKYFIFASDSFTGRGSDSQGTSTTQPL